MNQNLDNLRHSCAHLLAKAVLELWPGSHNAIGPAIDNGFYQDFDMGQVKISDADLPKIEAKMRQILPTWTHFEFNEVTLDEARKLFKHNPYKIELLEEFASEGKKLLTNNPGDFLDLCKMGHVENPSQEMQHFKLLSVAGAYWRGNKKNKMLTRIYGTCWPTQKELDDYLKMRDESLVNDHRILGKKLDLFAFSDLVGKGLVMYTPRGTIIKNELKEALIQISKNYGVQEVNIPHMAKIDLYKISGHADKFSNELFKVVSHYDEEFVLKPVNCPHHTQIYASKQRSYRDLPIRYIESTQQHRDEKPGEIGGLNRSRSFEIDDGHTFCTPDQIKQEVINTVKIIEEFYTALGMWGKHWVSLSFRDPKTPEKYIGDLPDWEKAQIMLQDISDELNLGAKVMIGEAALYGPKIDIMLKDALGNDRQLGTVQVDFAMPKRFSLVYVDKDGLEKTPVMLHRAILGSYGRFIANLIESTGGAFPTWLAPVQAIVLPISDKHQEYAQKVVDQLKEARVRVELNDKNEPLNARIRDAEMQKVPYILVVGDKEAGSDLVSVRHRHSKDSQTQSIIEFSSQVRDEIAKRTNN